MTATATAATWTSDPVTGDGTTSGSRLRHRWRRARWFLVGAAAFVLIVAVLLVARAPGSSVPYAPDNTGATGSQALARVLGDQGVDVEHVTHVADAIAASGPDSTLLVAPAPYLLSEQADALADAQGDLVLAGAGRELLSGATDDAVEVATSREPTTPAPPGCELAAAVAAGPSLLEAGLRAADDATACWPTDDVAALAAVERDGRRVTAVHDPAFLRNDTVTQEGNAALALHLLGGRERLVWLIQDPTDLTAVPDDAAPGRGSEPDTTGVLPDWFTAAAALGLLVVLVAAVWRGRRLGALVAEELPVVVPAAESTRGRARLYRRSRARGHAAAALRAATADNVAHRLGLPRSADAPAVVDAVVRATGRDPRDIDALLYGPPPTDDAELADLARRLDTLESEVHRP